MDFWLGDLRHVQLDWCACLNGESHFTDKLKIICLEIQNVFVIKLHNIFVKNTKYICSNHKIYLLKLRHIVQSLVSLISPKSRLLSLSCVMGRLCVTKKLFCPTVEFLARIYTFEQRPKNPKSSGWLRLTLKNLQDQNCINICRNIPRKHKIVTNSAARDIIQCPDISWTVGHIINCLDTFWAVRIYIQKTMNQNLPDGPKSSGYLEYFKVYLQVSTLHLCCISLDRYFAIVKPFDYHYYMNTR